MKVGDKLVCINNFRNYKKDDTYIITGTPILSRKYYEVDYDYWFSSIKSHPKILLGENINSFFITLKKQRKLKLKKLNER